MKLFRLAVHDSEIVGCSVSASGSEVLWRRGSRLPNCEVIFANLCVIFEVRMRIFEVWSVNFLKTQFLGVGKKT